MPVSRLGEPPSARLRSRAVALDRLGALSAYRCEAHDGAVVNEPPIRLNPVGSRPWGLPVVLLSLAVGVGMGLWLGRATPAGPTVIATEAATATGEASATASSTTQGRRIVTASVAPDLMQAYYFTRVTSSGLEPVVCTTGTVLACKPVAAHEVLDIERSSPAPVPIPGPDDLWAQLTPVHLDRAGAAGDVIVVDDLSPALFSQIVYQPVGVGLSWTDGGSSVTPVSVNGAVAIMDLGFLGVGRYVVLIRSVYSVPPDQHGLVEAWKAIGVEVDG
jgi:hypothetical protein